MCTSTVRPSGLTSRVITLNVRFTYYTCTTTVRPSGLTSRVITLNVTLTMYYMDTGLFVLFSLKLCFTYVKYQRNIHVNEIK